MSKKFVRVEGQTHFHIVEDFSYHDLSLTGETCLCGETVSVEGLDGKIISEVLDSSHPWKIKFCSTCMALENL